MGVDIKGVSPSSERGEHFQNNWWNWRPLWEFVCDVAGLSDEMRHAGHFNDGLGLGETDCRRVAEKIRALDSTGVLIVAEKENKNLREALPDEVCKHCHGTGVRNDAFVKGECNGCSGSGKVRPNLAHYPLTRANVLEFTDFLETCGGFEIW